MTENYPHQIIRASAGTGKTYALTTAYLDLLDQNASATSILATTFTRKAAHEISERVLQRAAEEAGNNPRRLQQLQDLCQNLHRLSIRTLDSLFSRIGQCFALELALPMTARVVDETEACVERLRERAIEEVLNDQTTPQMLDLLRRVHHDQAKSSVLDTLKTVMTSLYHTYHLAPRKEQWDAYPIGHQMDKASLKQLIEAHQNLEPHLPLTKTGTIHKRFQKMWETDIVLLARRDWKTFLSKGIAEKIAQGSTLLSTQEIPKPFLEVYTPLVHEAITQLIDQERQSNLARYQLAKMYAAHFDRLRLEQQMLFFSDIPRKLAKHIQESDWVTATELAYRLDQQIQHMLLDEFQDTSHEQWTILQPQAEEICSDARHFFCVGDVKQAIYGWRGGCAEIFNHLESQLGLPPEAIRSLNKSYRSSPVILKMVNLVCNNLEDNQAWDHVPLLPALAGQWQHQFENHIANDPHKPGYVELSTSPKDFDHLEFAAQKIAQLHQAMPGKTLGILVWKNKEVLALMQYLRDLHIDVAAEGGGVYLDDDPAISVILAAMRLAQRPDDTTAAFEILNSPLGPILGLQGYALSSTRYIAQRICHQLASEGYAATLGQWTRLLSPHINARSATRLTQLLGLAVRYDTDATLSPQEFVEFVQTTSVQQPNEAAVSIMTVHKAKGLQFDCVVLPALSKTAGSVSTQTPAYITRPSPSEPVEHVFAATNKEIRSQCEPLQRAYEQEEARRFSDDLCTFYVALTRPKHALYAMVPPLTRTKANKIGSAGFRDRSFAAVLRTTFTDPQKESLQGNQILWSDGDPQWYQPTQENWPKAKTTDQTIADKNTSKPTPPPQIFPQITWDKNSKAQRHLPRIAPSQLEGKGRHTARELLNRRHHQARDRGTAIHQWFEQIQWLPPEPSENISPEMTGSIHEAWLEEFGVMLKHPKVVELLSKPNGWDDAACELWQEQSFAIHLDGNLVHGQMDRVHLWPDRAILIDFKTDRVSDGELEARVDHYRPQIQLYRRVLAQLRGIPTQAIQTKLAFVQTGTIVDL